MGSDVFFYLNILAINELQGEIYTSVRLINYPESTTDSERTPANMKILKTVSKSPIDLPVVPKIFRLYTSPLIEISMDYDFQRIIEYHI